PVAIGSGGELLEASVVLVKPGGRALGRRGQVQRREIPVGEGLEGGGRGGGGGRCGRRGGAAKQQRADRARNWPGAPQRAGHGQPRISIDRGGNRLGLEHRQVDAPLPGRVRRELVA